MLLSAIPPHAVVEFVHILTESQSEAQSALVRGESVQLNVKSLDAETWQRLRLLSDKTA